MKKFSSTMRASSRRTYQNKRLLKIILIGAFVLLGIFLVPRIFSGVTAVIFTPINATKTWFTESSASLPYYLRERSKLYEETSRLKEQLSVRSGAQYTVDLLSRENKELRSLLGDNTKEKILAGIIGRPNQLPYDVLLLDKGTVDGIIKGSPVFIGDNTVVGIVQKTFLRSSIVELVTTPGFVVSVYIIGPDIYTNAVGIGGGQLRVGVPQGIDLQEGDLVVLPSVSSGVYGAISVVESVPSRPEQYGYVSTEIPLASMRLLGVGKIPLQDVSFEEAQEIVSDAKLSVFKVPVPDEILITTTSTSTESFSTTTTPDI